MIDVLFVGLREKFTTRAVTVKDHINGTFDELRNLYSLEMNCTTDYVHCTLD